MSSSTRTSISEIASCCTLRVGQLPTAYEARTFGWPIQRPLHECRVPCAECRLKHERGPAKQDKRFVDTLAERSLVAVPCQRLHAGCTHPNQPAAVCASRGGNATATRGPMGRSSPGTRNANATWEAPVIIFPPESCPVLLILACVPYHSGRA